MSRHYDEYFSVPVGYKANMTREAINESTDTWMNFYPHPKYIDFLRTLLDQLDGGSKSLWLTGNYGTGKSFAALVTQKLFVDDESRVKAWFDKRKDLIPLEVLDALLLQRKNGILFVYDYNAAGIGAHEGFLVRLERSIVNSLNEARLTIPPKAQLDEIIVRINEEGVNFFKTRDEIQSKLSSLHKGIMTTQQLASELSKHPIPDGLLEDVQQVLHERSIYLNLSAPSLLEWIKKVLDENNLKKIVYIFDEFSQFIEINKAELKTFEEIAEYSNTGLFYFIPVTHLSINAYWAEGSASAKKSNERFFFKELQMPNDTAFKLAGDALKVNDQLKDEWADEKAQLWSAISDFAGIHFTREDVSKTALQDIIPIHPMAAFLLKHLSTSAGANQRSIFEYLKGSANGHEFQDFIRKGGPGVPTKQFLTADYLWKYFIEREDLGLNKEVKEIRTAFERIRGREFFNRSEDDEDIRVLKTVMLFCLLNQLNPEGHDRLRPTVENIELSFKGDGAIVGVRGIIKRLADMQCFSLVGENIELFRSAVGGVELEKKIAEYDNKFHELLSDKLKDSLTKNISGYNPALRYDVRVSDVAHLNASLISATTRQNFSKDGNQVLICFVVAKNSQEHLSVNSKVESFLVQFYDHRMICITFSELTYCSDNSEAWNDYVHTFAQMMLANDSVAKKQYSEALEKMNQSWFERIKAKNVTMQAFKLSENKTCSSTKISWDELKLYLSNFVENTLPLCVDKLALDKVAAFKTDGLKSWATAGIQFETISGGTYKQIVTAFQSQGITADDDWFFQNPNHSIVKIKEFFETRIKNTVGKGTNLSVRRAYIELRRYPYGMRANALSAFVLGLSLRFILSKGYQWTNGQGTWPLNADVLASIIEAVVKDDGNDNIKNEQLICRLSKEEKAFVIQGPKIFGLTEDADGTVENALVRISERIESVSGHVPLWVIPEYVVSQADPQTEQIGQVINLLCSAFLISSKGKVEDRVNAVKEIGRILLDIIGIGDAIARYVKADVFALAFQQYINNAEPSLETLALSVSDNTKDYCNAILSKASETAGWLWKPTDVMGTVSEVRSEYAVIALVKELSSIGGFLNYKDSLAYVRSVVSTKNKLPKETLSICYPELAEFLDCISATANENVSQRILVAIENNVQLIKNIFFSSDASVQITIIKERLSKGSSIPDDDLRVLYNNLLSGFNSDENTFFSELQSKIVEYLKTSIIGQLAKQWEKFSGTADPDTWSTNNKLPAWTLFDNRGYAQDILNALRKPQEYTSEKLNDVLAKLSGLQVHTIAECQDGFFKCVVPRKYWDFNIDLASLLIYMQKEYGSQPNLWQPQPDVTGYIQQQYRVAIAPTIVDTLTKKSSDELKEKILKLAAENPDIGLLFWENANGKYSI